MAVLVRDNPGSLVLVKAAAKKGKRPTETLWQLVNNRWRGANVKNHASGIPGDGGTHYNGDELRMLAHMWDALGFNPDRPEGNIASLHNESAHPEPKFFGGGLINPDTGEAMHPSGATLEHLGQMGRKAISAMRLRHRRYISPKGAKGKGPKVHKETGEILPEYEDGPWGPGTGAHFSEKLRGSWRKKVPTTQKTEYNLHPTEGLQRTVTHTPKDGTEATSTTDASGSLATSTAFANLPKGDAEPSEKTGNALDDSFSTLSNEPGEGNLFDEASSDTETMPTHEELMEMYRQNQLGNKGEGDA